MIASLIYRGASITGNKKKTTKNNFACNMYGRAYTGKDCTYSYSFIGKKLTKRNFTVELK